MKILILYYSLDGNSKMISEAIGKETGATVEEIETVNPIAKPESFMKYIWGGRMVMMNQIPEIKPIKSNLNDYDLIVLGTPVWAWTYSPPIGALFEEYEFKNKKVAIFCCHGGGPGKTLEKMKEKLDKSIIISENDFRDPLKIDTELQKKKAIDWIKGLIKDLT